MWSIKECVYVSWYQRQQQPQLSTAAEEAVEMREENKINEEKTNRQINKRWFPETEKHTSLDLMT